MSEVHIDGAYWGDRLEVSTDVVLQQHAEDSYMSRWVDGLSPRCRALLVEHFDIDAEDLTIKKLTRGNPTMAAKFAELKGPG